MIDNPKAPIDMVRRHGAEKFHGTSLEESERAGFWLEKLQRVLDEVSVILSKRFHVRSHFYKVGLMIGCRNIRL